MSRLSILALTVVAVLMTACAPASPSAPPAVTPGPTSPVLPPTVAPSVQLAAPTGAPAAPGTKVLRIGRAIYPELMDPQKTPYSSDIGVLTLAYEGLLAIDEKGAVGPGSADKWTWSDDGKSMTFHIRDGLVRYDGTPITAADFEYALKREVDPCVPDKQYTSVMYDVKGAAELDALNCKKDAAKLDAAWQNYGVKALDASNLQVTFNSPIGFWQYIAYMWVTYPTDKRQVDKDPDLWWTKPSGHVGNGPFRIQSMGEMKKIVLVANDKYWRGRPKIDRIELSYNLDTSVILAAYGNNELDANENIAPESVARFTGDPKLKSEFLRVPTPATIGLAFNLTKKPFDDINVRKAFSAAFDREAFARDVYHGVGGPYTRWIPPGVPGAQPEKPGVPAYDPKAAVKYLVDNGYAAKDSTPDKPKVDCEKLGTLKLTYSGSPLNTARNQWIAGNWAGVFGCPVTLDPVEPTAMGGLMKKAETRPKVTWQTWEQDYPHPQNWLSVYWMCGAFAARQGYCNKEFDRLVQQADRTIDFEQALALYRQAEDLLISDVPSVFAYNGENLRLVKPWVLGPKEFLSLENAGWAAGMLPYWSFDIDLFQVPAGYPKQ